MVVLLQHVVEFLPLRFHYIDTVRLHGVRRYTVDVKK